VKVNSELLVELQRGIPVCENPFEVVGRKFSLSATEVVGIIREFLQSGKARRFGGIFDSKRLGYMSTLCAVRLDNNMLQQALPIFLAESGITHCYLRGCPEQLQGVGRQPEYDILPNIWFTYIHERGRFDSGLRELSKKLAPAKVLSLPALQRFKIDVIFNPTGGMAVSALRDIVDGKSLPKLTSQEKSIIACLQGNLSLREELFADIANRLGIAVDKLLVIVQKLQTEGRLKRIGMVLRHHKVGFKANAMCVWQVREEDVARFGKRLAECSEVTHCYQRPRFENFNYDLYAMIHTDSWQKTRLLFEEISDRCDLQNGVLMCSLKEYKKTSPEYFELG